MQTLNCPTGPFILKRYPVRNKETLRAWDAADEYILNYLDQQQLLQPHSSILILNDSFGALGCALAEYTPVSVSDSWIAHQGLQQNLSDNGIAPQSVIFKDALSDYAGQTTPFDLVVIKITKSLAQLEDQLHRLRDCITPATRIIAAGMVKSIHSSTLKLFEQTIGTTTTSLAVKKARLIFSQYDPDIKPPANSYPKQYRLENSEHLITNHASVFSREKLDIGTRFFLENLPTDNRYESIIDLGCGNGLVGLLAAEKNPDAHITFCDESYMAVASARENFLRAFPDKPADFRVTDCLQGILPASADLILNNPPFHQQNTVGDFIAWQMFKESHKTLKEGGEIWVIGNRHLGYHIKLKRLFNNCQTVASNKKFVILKAIKT